MDNFNDEDIIMFLESYKTHILENPLLNSKIPIWVEFLRAKKHYRENGMEEDYFFKKRFGISQDDLIMIHKLIDRVKRGKTLTRNSRTHIQGNSGINSLSSFSAFDENEQIQEGQEGKFELLGQVQNAMDDYYKKMKKNADKKKSWKKNSRSFESNLPYDPEGCIDSEPDLYYTKSLNSESPHYEFDVQTFGRSPLVNMGKTNIIQKIDKISNSLNNDQLITNDFDTEYKRAVPNLSLNKKVQFTNQIDTSIIDSKEKNNYGNEVNYNKNTFDVGAARFWQDQDILNARGNTRNTCVPNKNSFEHQFDYLDGNYNRVPDPRLLGTSSRLENRSNFRR